MPYLTGTQLAQILPGTYSAQTNPNIAELDALVGYISAEVDGAAAAAGYVVPITPAASGGPTEGNFQLSMIVQLGAGWHALRRAFPNMGGPGDQSSMAAEYRDAYNQKIKDLESGNLVIIGANTDTSGSGGRQLPRSYSTSNREATSGVTPHVTMGDLW